MSEIKSDLTAASGANEAVSAKRGAMLPRVDVFEDETGITIRGDVPGVAKEQLTLRVEGDALVFEGEIAPVAPGVLEPVYAEVRGASYRRSFTLSRELDGSRTQASLKDGVLTLRIPKQQKAQPQRIAIQLD